MQVRHGVLVCVTDSHVEDVGSIPVMFHYANKNYFFFYSGVILIIEQLCIVGYKNGKIVQYMQISYHDLYSIQIT